MAVRVRVGARVCRNLWPILRRVCEKWRQIFLNTNFQINELSVSGKFWNHLFISIRFVIGSDFRNRSRSNIIEIFILCTWYFLLAFIVNNNCKNKSVTVYINYASIDLMRHSLFRVHSLKSNITTFTRGIVESRIKVRKGFFQIQAWRITLNFLEHFIPDSEKNGFRKREPWHSRWLAPLFWKDCSISNLKDSRSKVLSFGARKKLVSQRINDLLEIIRILQLNLKILLKSDFQLIRFQLENFSFSTSSVGRLS